MTQLVFISSSESANIHEALSEPSELLIETLRGIAGDVLVLGVGGKIGPTVALMARRAFDTIQCQRRVIGVSRFRDLSVRQHLEMQRIETIQGDLLDSNFVQSLPACGHVVFLAGTKFGTVGHEPYTWAINAFLPGIVAQHFRDSRIVVLSTGNVYGPVAATARGAKERDPLNPIGEYAMSCVGRERVFDYFSTANGTKTIIVRLNYATELRYGVLLDIAMNVAQGQPISLRTAWVNVIWQRDACDWILRCIAHADSPAAVINITGPERLSVQHLAERFGELLGRSPRFTCEPGPKALLSDCAKAVKLFGEPSTCLESMLQRTAGWVASGNPVYNKPTHFDVTDGRF